jgi:hypothetical protein
VPEEGEIVYDVDVERLKVVASVLEVVFGLMHSC